MASRVYARSSPNGDAILLETRFPAGTRYIHPLKGGDALPIQDEDRQAFASLGCSWRMLSSTSAHDMKPVCREIWNRAMARLDVDLYLEGVLLQASELCPRQASRHLRVLSAKRAPEIRLRTRFDRGDETLSIIDSALGLENWPSLSCGGVSPPWKERPFRMVRSAMEALWAQENIWGCGSHPDDVQVRSSD